MIILIIGLFIFLGIHSISLVNESWRDQLVLKIGRARNTRIGLGNLGEGLLELRRQKSATVITEPTGLVWILF